MSTPRSIHLVDVVKFISAFLVVGIHTQPFRYHEIIEVWLFWPVVSLAVPYFLIVSAYFFWNREKPELFRYLVRIGLLYFVWFIIDIPILYKELFSSDITIKGKLFLFFRGLFFGQTFPGSWFLSCSIWGIVISYTFWKYKIRSQYLILFGLLLYTIGKILIYFQSILPEPFLFIAVKFSTIYGIMQISTFTYFVFVFLGYLMVIDKRFFVGFRSKWFLFFGILITFFELRYNHLFNYPISVIAPLIIIPFMLAFTVSTPFTISDQIAIRLRKMSTLIYFIHPTFVHLCPPLGSEYVTDHPFLNFILVSILSAMISYFLSSKRLSSLVKYLY